MGNIIGEPIEDFVANQVDLRQKIYGAGYNENSLARTPEYLNYLNNRNAWIKLASGVELYDFKQYLIDKNEIAFTNAINEVDNYRKGVDYYQQTYGNSNDALTQLIINKSNAEADTREAELNEEYLLNTQDILRQAGTTGYNKGTQRLKDLQKFSTDGYFTENDVKSLDGINLAKKYVLFNTIQEYKDNTYVNRSGVRTNNSWSSSQNKIYGGMGSNERGLQPVPGIIDVSVDTVNRGSIKKATVTLKAFNKFQFGIIEILYLRLGYTMMLEYGWDKQLNSDANGNLVIEDMGSTIIENEWFKNKAYTQREMSNIIKDYTERYGGNYSGFFGKVNNFSWKLNKDNTYDITINLVSLGSVIESLEVAIPSAISIVEKSTQESTYKTTISAELSDSTQGDLEDLEEEGTLNENLPISLNAGNDAITNFCMSSIINMKSYIQKGDTNYFYVNNKFAKVKNRFFIRFGHLLDFVQSKIVGDVTNKGNSSPRLEIDTNVDNNYISYTPNLIPLEPSIGIFTPLTRDIVLGTKDYFRNPFPVAAVQGIVSLPEDFAVLEQGVYYAKLMNVYLNVSFVISSLNSNKDKEENLSLFRFLEALCDGINKTMGNSTKITPSVKDDNIVYFIDENPIIGYDKIFPSQAKKSVPINLFGYNPNGTSNFVKDFGFQTKITPKTMNQISIGATAGGYQNATDAVGYKWWNRGLKNRFEETYNTTDFLYNDTSNDDALYENFKKLVEIGDSGNGDRAYRRGGNLVARFGYRLYYRNKGKIFYRDIDVNRIKKSNSDETNFKSSALKSEVIKFMKDQDAKFQKEQNIANYDKDVREFKLYEKSLESCYPVNELIKEGVYLYGAEKNSIFVNKSPLFTLSEDQISGLKSTFKAYKVALEDASFKTDGTNSNQTGFIPVELSFSCDGLSGWKIYNQLDVNQRELPASYPEALRFIIRGIKDKISGNTWETSIETISQPPTKKTLNTKTLIGSSDSSDIGKGKYTGPEENKYSLIQGISLETDRTFNGLIYIPTETPKSQVVLHHTANNSSIASTINYWRQGENNVSTHFVIQRDGSYDQLFDLKYWAYHLGSDDKSLNQTSIGIELESFGYFNSYEKIDGEYYLKQDGKVIGTTKEIGPGTGTPFDYHADQAYEMVTWANSISSPISSISYGRNGNQYRGYNGWQGYTFAQINTLYNILLMIQEKYPNIPLGINSREAYLDMFPPLGKISQNAINRVPGIYTHNSYRGTQKTDVYPANNLISMLSGRSTQAPRFGDRENNQYNLYGYVNDYGSNNQRINFRNTPLKFRNPLSDETPEFVEDKAKTTILKPLNRFKIKRSDYEIIAQDYLNDGGRLEYKHTIEYELPDGTIYTAEGIGERKYNVNGPPVTNQIENAKRVAKDKAENKIRQYLEENNIQDSLLSGAGSFGG